MSGNDAEPIFLTIATSPNSTQTMIEVLTLAAGQDGWPRYGAALRHLADILDGNGGGGRPETAGDAALVDRVIALGAARGGTVGNLLWALRKVSDDEAEADRGTPRANYRRLLPKVERALGKILADN
jgi:hypothetical protein